MREGRRGGGDLLWGRALCVVLQRKHEHARFSSSLQTSTTMPTFPFCFPWNIQITLSFPKESWASYTRTLVQKN